MKASSVFIKHSSVLIVVICILIFSTGRCQEEDEDDEDTYDEELGEDSSTTTTTRRPARSSTPKYPDSSPNRSVVTERSTVRATEVDGATPVVVPTPDSAPAPTRAPVRATTLSEYEDDEFTTEEEGYGYIFRPLNQLVENIVAGNVTGIVDHALSIRTPPEIRQFVNNVMSNVFGAGIGNALKQIMPNLFTTQAPSTSRPERDPIPTRPSSPNRQTVVQDPIPITAVLTARTNGSEDSKSSKIQQPIQVALAHPGAPASRLKCEVIS